MTASRDLNPDGALTPCSLVLWQACRSFASLRIGEGGAGLFQLRLAYLAFLRLDGAPLGSQVAHGIGEFVELLAMMGVTKFALLRHLTPFYAPRRGRGG
jgi:hypothetical protein